MAKVLIDRIVKRFGAVRAVNGVSLAVEPAQIVSLLGPSGCGKTTTLRCVAGLDTPDEGEIRIGDRIVFSSSRRVLIPPEKRRIGMVFQSYALWPHMTVAENVAIGLKLRGLPRHEVEEKVHQALEMVRLSGMLSRYPHQLSGGQQQRVALARSLVLEPDVLLFDEPLSNLDASLREEMRFEIREIVKRLGITALYVTHDQAEAMAISDLVCVMDHGNIVQVGSPQDIYERPATRFVAEFVGTTNILSGVVVGNRPDAGTSVRLDCGTVLTSRSPSRECFKPGQRVEVGIRAEHLLPGKEVTSASNILRATLRGQTYLGNTWNCLFDVGGARLRAQLQSKIEAEPGTELSLYVPPERCLLFPAAEPAPSSMSGTYGNQ